MELNSRTHFPLVQQSNNEFQFVTSAGVIYKLTVFECNYINQYPGNIYEISFYPTDGVIDKFDSKISNTITHFISELLQIKPDNCISFICDSSDNRQHARKRLFDSWYKNYSTYCCKIDAELTDIDNNIIYCSIITNNNNPYMQHLKNQYFSAVTDYSK